MYFFPVFGYILSALTVIIHGQRYNDDASNDDSLEFDLNLSNLGANINQHVRDITSQINGKNLNSNLNQMEFYLHNLGTKINEQVQESLKPVNAMAVKSAMARGVGGTTHATFGDKLEQIIIDGNKYTCPGKIIKEVDKVRCDQKLKPVNSNDEDVCTANSYSRVNNNFCFGNYVSFSCTNNACRCTGGKMYTLAVIRNICGNTYGTRNYAIYDYYPNKNDEAHITLPNPNDHVTCENNNDNSNHCVWHSTGILF